MSEFDNINPVENSNEDVTGQNETPSKQLEQDTSTIELLREQILLRDTANVYGESKKKQPRLKTKKSKRILASILISILAFLLIGGSGTYMFYGNKIKQAVMGDAKYFAYVESKNLKGGVNEAVDSLQFLNQNGSTKDIKPDMSTDISFTPSDYTNTSLAGMGKILSQLGIRVTNVSSGKNTMMAIDISSKGEKIATAELINTPEQTVVRIQELSDKFINIPQEQILQSLSVTSGTNINMVSSLNFESKAMKDELKRLVDIVINQLDDVKISNDVSIQIGGQTVKLNEIKVTISGDKQKSIAKNLLQEIQSSDVIYGAISGDIKHEDYKAYFTSLLESVEKYDAKGDPLIYTMYVDNNEKIVGRSLANKDGAMSYQSNKTNDVNYFEGSFKTGANETKLVLSEDSKSKYITVTADKEEVKLDYSDIVINKTQMIALGKFELTTSNNAFYANGSIDANEEGLKFDFSPKVSNNAIGQFKLDVKKLEKGSVKIPTVDPAKIVKPEEYMADNTLMEKLQQLIKKLDIPQGLIPGMS